MSLISRGIGLGAPRRPDQGKSPEAIPEHARRAGVPANKVLPVGELVVVTADPGKWRHPTSERAAP